MFQIQLITRTLFSWIGLRFAHLSPTYVAFTVCFAAVMIVSTPLQAQLSRPSIEEEPDQPWQIEADEVGYDDATKEYVAKGNVVIKKRDLKLTADSVRFDSQTMKAVAIGNVVMTAGEDVLVGNSIEINLASETGILYQASIFLKENHFYIKGDKLKKIGKDSYAAEKASISTCDGEPPAWKITGRNMKISVEGYGTVQHGALWAKNVPVLYSPYMIFPTKRKRQSGLLFPELGTSDRKGFRFIQPYFWAISESTDATFYWDHMQKRGEKLGAEYRYVLDSESKGTLMVDYLDDREVDDGVGDSGEKWGFTDDEALRPNSDRYWFRMKADQRMPYKFTGKLDLDIVSDQDYLPEFRDGYTGFDRSEDYFSGYFGRGFNDYTDRVRKNQLNFNRSWTGFSLNAAAQYFDDVVLRRQSDIDPTLQKLPFIEFDGPRQRIFQSPFYFELDSEYTYFYRKDGQTGHRTDIFPRFYYPLRVGNYFTFEPSFGIRDTFYYLDRREAGAFEGDRVKNRLIPDIELDLLSEVFNVFPVNVGGADKIKHSIRPQVIYNFTPDIDQDDLPSFDDTDRISEENLLTYSLTTTLISRRLEKKASKGAQATQVQTVGSSAYTYHQFLRFKLEQSYDIKKELDDEPEPFTPLEYRIDFVPIRYVSLEADGKWSPYDRNFEEHNIAVTFSDDRGDKLLVEHRFTEDENESIYVDGHVKLTDRITFYGEHEYNLRDDIRLRTGGGFRYTSQCWAVDVRFIDEVSDRRFEFAINLVGLGAFRRAFGGRSIGNPFSGL